MSAPSTTIVPTFRRVDGDDPDSDLNKWIKSIPDTFTPTEARAASVEALSMAQRRIGVVRDQYSGTLPPSPWPATPEVLKSIEQMEGARAFFGKIADAGSSTTWKKTDKAWIALSRAGSDLFDSLDQLEHKSANAPALKDMLSLVPDPRSLILGRFPIKNVALGAVALYFLFPQVKRIVGRTLGLRRAGARARR